MAVILLLAVFIFPIFAPMGARHSAIKAHCLSNIKQVNLALLMYQGDFSERMPPAAAWVPSTYPYTKNTSVYRCPVAFKADPTAYGYALNDLTCGRDLSKEKHPEKVVAVFESSNLRINAHDALASIMKPGRHSESSIYGFLDGHAKSFKDGSNLP